jgi:hypothetical protein
MRLAVPILLFLAAAVPIQAQTVPPAAQTVSLSGPRFGVTGLSPGVVDALAEREIEVSHLITQFGWQFEKQFYSTEGGLTAVTEWVGLLGGLEQSVVLPSLTWMVGIRTKDGAEFGIGPNFTPAGSALALAAGVTFRVGVMNVPVNVAVVPSKAGTRVSLLTGFNLRSRTPSYRTAPPRTVPPPRPPRYPCIDYVPDALGRLRPVPCGIR